MQTRRTSLDSKVPRGTGTKLVDHWPVSYHRRRGVVNNSKPGRNSSPGSIELEPANLIKAKAKKIASRNPGKRKRSQNTEVNPKTKRPCRERETKQGPPSISFTDLPTELVLNVLHFCSPDDILSLSQLSFAFRSICSSQYLRRIGIVVMNGNGSIQICLFGGPFSPSAMAFLPDVDFGSRISLICDLFHALSFSSDIIQFLRNHSIRAFEIRPLRDELDILEDPSFAVVIQSILSAIAPTCEQISFSAPGGQALRTLPSLRHTNSKPVRRTRCLTSKYLNLMESVTELRLSSVFSRAIPLWATLSHLLHLSAIEVVTLDCDTYEDSSRILRSMAVPRLEMLSISTHDRRLPMLPISFNKLHSRLKFLSMLDLRSWNTPDFLRLPSTHLSLPSLSHLQISSNYSSFEIQDAAELSRLRIISFVTLPVPKNRGYCNVVDSLTRALRSPISTSSQHFSASLTVSFTFPRFLDAHLRFCEEHPVYKCSCSPGGHPVQNIRNIDVQADILSEAFMGYIRTWISQFPHVVHLNIVTDRLAISELPPLSSFHSYCQQLLTVTLSCSGDSEMPLSLK